MGAIKSIEAGNRGLLADLFKKHRRHRMFIDSMVEGYVAGFGQGRLSAAMADSETVPQVAQFAMEGYALFGGDPTHPVARMLVEHVPQTVRASETWEGLSGITLVPEADAWRDLFLDVYKDRLTIRRVVEFAAAHLDVDYLRKLSAQVPEGFTIRRFDLESMRRWKFDLNRQGMGYVPLRKFAKHGICYRVMKGPNREYSVGEAFSYVMCRAGIEVSIGIEEDYQHRGLATAVGATLLVKCLEQGFEPHWMTSSNPRSNGLAEKLGYVRDKEYEVFHLICNWDRKRPVTFVNASDRPVDICRVIYEQPDEAKYWVEPDFAGKVEKLFMLAPGERIETEIQLVSRLRALDAETGQQVREDVIPIEKMETFTIS